MICAPDAHVKALLLLSLWVTLSGGGSLAAAQGSLDRLSLPEGGQVYWEEDRLSYLVDARASARLSLEEVRARLRAAASAWSGAPCAGISFIERPSRLGEPFGYQAGEENTNLVLFRREEGSWPHDPSVVALTTLTYCEEEAPERGCRLGKLLDADIELNELSFFFTTEDEAPRIDLESVFSHELGHFLGFVHSAVSSSIMTPALSEGTIRRTLSPADQESLCWFYPLSEGPEPAEDRGAPEADRGSEEALPLPENEGCSSAPGKGGRAALLWLTSLLLYSICRRERGSSSLRRCRAKVERVKR